MNLGALVASTFLTLSPTDYQVVNFQHQKAPIYAQASQEDLSTRLLREADEKAKKNPVAAIPLYQKVLAEDGPLKEEAVGRLLDIYKRVTDKVLDGSLEYNEKYIKDAFDFYSEVEDISNNPHSAKAKLYYGILLWRWQAPENFDYAIEKLSEAYKIGNKKIKVESAWHLALITWNYATNYPEIGLYKKYDISYAKEYFQKVIQLAPNSEYAKKARKLLETDTFQKIK